MAGSRAAMMLHFTLRLALCTGSGVSGVFLDGI